MRSPSRRKRTKRPKSRVGKKGSRQKHETRSARSRRSRSKRSRPPRKGVRYGQQDLPDRNRLSEYESDRSVKLSPNIAEPSSSSELTLKLSQLKILPATSFLINKTENCTNLVAVLDVNAKIDDATMTTGGLSYNLKNKTDEKVSLEIAIDKYNNVTDPDNSISKATISLQPTTLDVSAIDGKTKNETKLSLSIGKVSVTVTRDPSTTGLDDSGSTETIRTIQPTTLDVSVIDAKTSKQTVGVSLPIGNVTVTATRDSLGLDSLFDTVDEYHDMIFTGLDGGETLLKDEKEQSLYPLKMNVSSSEQGGYTIQFAGDEASKPKRSFFEFSIDFNLDLFQFENCVFIAPLIEDKIPPVLNDIMKEYVTTPTYRGIPALFSKFGLNVLNAMKDSIKTITNLQNIRKTYETASNMSVNEIRIARVNKQKKEQNKTKNESVLRIQFLIASSLITRIIGMTGQEMKATLEKMVSPQSLGKVARIVLNNVIKIKKPKISDIILVANDDLAQRMNGQIRSEGINVKRTLDKSDMTPYVMKKLKADPTVVVSDLDEKKKKRKALYESLFGRIGLKRREQETSTGGGGSSSGIDVCLDGETPCDSNLFFSDNGSIELRFKMK